MDRPEWSGFDARKVCPRCGGYQTHVWIVPTQGEAGKLPFAWMAVALVILLLFLSALFILAAFPTALSRGDPIAGFSLIFVALLVALLLNRHTRPFLTRNFPAILKLFRFNEAENSSSTQPPTSASVLYQLSCQTCGYRWQKTALEWEQQRQKELDTIARQPASSPPSVFPAEEYPKIEWRPPDPRRGAFIVISAVFLLFMAGILLYSLFRSAAHPDSSAYPVVLALGAFFILWISIGTMFLFKSRLLRSIPILLFALFWLLLWYFMR
jgi:hypothetical protein